MGTHFPAAVAAVLAAIVSTASVSMAQEQAPLTVLSPRQLQVFQRETKDVGHVPVSGRVKGDFDKAEVRFVGKGADGKELPDQWHAVTSNTMAKSFIGRVPVPAGGWYKVEVRASKAGQPVGQP